MRRKSSVLTLTVVTIVFLILILQTNRKGAFGKRNTSFAVPADKEITMIEMTQAGEKLTLRLHDNDNVWTVNDAGEARKSAVSFMIQTLNSIAIKSPVSDVIFRSEIIEKHVVPVTVKVYSGRRMVNKFLVYKTESNIYGNIMKMSERNEPFIVSIPGFEGAIGSNFNMNELFWVPFNIFSSVPGDIASVEVDYTDTPDESFLVYNYSVSSSHERERPGIEGFDSVQVRRYLSYFTWVPFETWAFDLGREQSDSIASGVPLATIIVTLTSGAKEKLTIWERSKVNNETLSADTDRAWGKKDDNSNLFVVRYFDIDPLLRRKSYFFGQE